MSLIVVKHDKYRKVMNMGQIKIGRREGENRGRGDSS